MTKLTNVLRLPEPIVAAVANDSYRRGECDITVTELLDPPRKVELERRHDDELTEDVSERIWALAGQVVHGVLERANRTGVAEPRLYIDVEGWKVGGSMDRLELAVGKYFGVDVTDWKFVTGWAVKGGTWKPEWEQQLNCYAEILHQRGYAVRSLKIVAILRDWSKLEVLRNRDYPKRQVVVLNIPLWPRAKAQQFLSERVRLHQYARIALPECTPEERWHRGEVWAAHKGQNKKAAKLFQTPEAAEQWVAAQKVEHRIEHRPGESIRCQSYCSAAPVCEQWKEIRENAEMLMHARLHAEHPEDYEPAGEPTPCV